MSKSYGECVGCNAALTWVRELKNVNDSIRECVLHRMMYEFDKDIPVKPKYHKGKYGKRYDSYSCGNCGAGIPEAHWTYCPNCGFRIAKNERQEQTREEFTQLTLMDFGVVK